MYGTVKTDDGEQKFRLADNGENFCCVKLSLRSLLSLFSGGLSHCRRIPTFREREREREREFCCHLKGRCRPERLESEFNDSIRNMTFIVQ
jgi:hypothetical protein